MENEIFLTERVKENLKDLKEVCFELNPIDLTTALSFIDKSIKQFEMQIEAKNYATASFYLGFIFGIFVNSTPQQFEQISYPLRKIQDDLILLSKWGERE